MNDQTTGPTTVRHEPDAHRYVIEVDGKLAGFTQYRLRDGGATFDFVHTEIDPAYSGHGLGGTLVSQALTDARDLGKTIVPTCPFVAAWIEKHPDFDGAVERPS